MTPQQVEEAARRRYNGENDTFFSQDEVFKVIYEAELELSTAGLVIEAVDSSTTTVIGTRAYSFPSNFIALKRVEYNGLKLKITDFRDDDRLTVQNSVTTQQGTPFYYQIFSKTIYLRPIPDAAQTLTIYGYKEPTLLTTASSTLSTPSEFHMDLVDFVTMVLCAKDKDYEGVALYQQRWEAAKKRARQWQARRKRADGFNSVKNEESYTTTYLGIV